MAGASKGRVRIVAPMLLLCAALVAPFLGQLDADAQTSSLGAGLTVLPTDDGTEADLGGNNRLWFNVAPGGTASRRFSLNSQSDLTQQVTFEMLNMLVVDGTPQIDPSGPTPLADWVTFSPERVDLEPRGRVEVTMTVGVPDGAVSEAQRGYLRVLVGAADGGGDVESPTGTTAQVGNILAFAQDVWVGVGGADGELLVTDFEIDGVQGILEPGSEDKALRIRFRNTGETPLGLEGTVELRSLDFEDLRIGPLEFNTSEILPGERGFVDVPVDATTVEGDWQILIRARQGQIVRTEILEERLEFLIPGTSSPLRALAIRGGLFLLGLLALIVSVRLLRRPAPVRATVAASAGPDAEAEDLAGSTVAVSTVTPSAVVPNEPDPVEHLAPVVPMAPVAATEADIPPQLDASIPSEPRLIKVHVLGAVRRPGLIALPDDSRIGDAIEAAGGATAHADLSSFNLARRLRDGQQLAVPSTPRPTANGRPRSTASRRNGTTPASVDPNRATIKQLAALPGMSSRLAEEIVRHRREQGRFTTVESLLGVSGIGPKRLETIRTFLRIDQTADR